MIEFEVRGLAEKIAQFREGPSRGLPFSTGGRCSCGNLIIVARIASAFACLAAIASFASCGRLDSGATATRVEVINLRHATESRT